MEDLLLITNDGDEIVFDAPAVKGRCCINVSEHAGDSAYAYINKDQAIFAIKHLTELFEIKNNSTGKLVAMVKELDAELAKGLNYIDSPRQAEVHHLINEIKGE